VNGGSVGVSVFFALSGFLITSLLVEERQGAGDISFRRFYERRARRLLPALIVYLAFWVALSALGIGPYRSTPAEVIAALFYFMNWVIASGVPVSHPMGITWSLSVEEQFYLLWPVVFLLAARRPRGPRLVAAAGVVSAVALRFESWDGPGSGGPIYYRTDTRMDTLLVGCLVALLVHQGHLLSSRRARTPMSAALLVALLVIHNDVLRYVLEPLLVAVATCGLIVAALAREQRWLSWSPLRWFGKRSYALYLWHYPLVVMAWSTVDVLPMWVAIVLALVAAEASWWLVERRFLRPRSGRATPPGLSTLKSVEPPALA
jgi:peptidoglycan/LPS O-acetylase OafA/YrhL